MQTPLETAPPEGTFVLDREGVTWTRNRMGWQAWGPYTIWDEWDDLVAERGPMFEEVARR